jgi:transposase-like protein
MRKYSIEDKLKCIELVEEIGYQKVSEMTGIDRKSLKEWQKKKKQLQSMDNKENSFRLPGGGAKPKTAEKEQQIVKFIEDCLQIGIKVDTSLIINELCRISPEMLQKTRRTLRKWCYRFLKRHKYT